MTQRLVPSTQLTGVGASGATADITVPVPLAKGERRLRRILVEHAAGTGTDYTVTVRMDDGTDFLKEVFSQSGVTGDTNLDEDNSGNGFVFDIEDSDSISADEKTFDMHVNIVATEGGGGADNDFNVALFF